MEFVIFQLSDFPKQNCPFFSATNNVHYSVFHFGKRRNLTNKLKLIGGLMVHYFDALSLIYAHFSDFVTLHGNIMARRLLHCVLNWQLCFVSTLWHVKSCDDDDDDNNNNNKTSATA